eukprot:TRINITY_DN3504_c0_g1_i2.p1 TRINITY_DN3504_c0_g1~~TRINITY_DN3504_c0_g1_i2.p1  ORF type:complete len:122 (-),score=1.09 TRINITY_DN3504_c0_g1_i2:27-392(-)
MITILSLTLGTQAPLPLNIISLPNLLLCSAHLVCWLPCTAVRSSAKHFQNQWDKLYYVHTLILWVKSCHIPIPAKLLTSVQSKGWSGTSLLKLGSTPHGFPVVRMSGRSHGAAVSNSSGLI